MCILIIINIEIIPYLVYFFAQNMCSTACTLRSSYLKLKCLRRVFYYDALFISALLLESWIRIVNVILLLLLFFWFL